MVNQPSSDAQQVPLEGRDTAGFHVVAAVATESQWRRLLALGCALTSHRGGHLTVLHVTAGNRHPEWLEVPDECGSVPIQIVVQVGKDPAGEILSAVRRDPPDLLLAGWRGRSGRGRYLLGRNLDRLVQDAPCDVAIVRSGTDKPLQSGAPEEIRRVLVPMGGGPNAPLAMDLALALSPTVRVTALNIARNVQGPVAVSLARERLSGDA